MGALELLQDSLGLILGILFGVLAVLIWMLVRLARASQAAPTIESDMLAMEGVSTPEAIDLTVPPPRPDLRRSFARARAALRRAFPGSDASYDPPWVLVAGPTLAGKTTLMARSRPATPFGQPRQKPDPGHPGINWWALDRGVVLDVAGEDVLRTDGSRTDEAEWKSILRRVRDSRRRRPLDSVVLTLPADYLWGDEKPLGQRKAEASRRGTLLHRKLAEAQRILGMRLPIYVLVSHCDHIPGFTSIAQAGPAASRQQIFGWSSPHAPHQSYSPAWLEQALETITNELDAYQLQLLASGAAPADAEDLIAFPNRFFELLEPLRIYANHLFGSGEGEESPSMRGVFFCGSVTALGDGSPHSTDLAHPGTPSEVAFVGDLFRQKILPEAPIARPTHRAKRRAGIRRAALIALTVVLAGWCGVAISRGGASVARAATATRPFLSSIEEQKADAVGANQLVTVASGVERYGFRTPILPASYLSRFQPRFNRAVETGFRSQVFPPFLSALEEDTKRLIGWSSDRGSDSASATTGDSSASGDASSTTIEDLPQFESLRRFSLELQDLDQAIADYQRFSTEGDGPLSTALSDFNDLSSSIIGNKLNPSSSEAGAFLGRRLDGLGVPAFDHDRSSYSQRMKDTVDDLTDALFAVLFTGNPMVVDLGAIADKWAALTASSAWASNELESYESLLESLQDLQTLIASPGWQWTAGDVADLGTTFDDIVRRIYNSPFLGPEVATEIQDKARRLFATLQTNLTRARDGQSGVSLVRKDGEWQLSSTLSDALAGLGEVLDQPFVKSQCNPHTMEYPPADRILLWDPSPLQKALSLFDEYQAWQKSAKLPSSVQSTAPQVTREAIGHNVICLIEAAQTFASPPTGSAGGQVEDSLQQQVQNLQANETTLASLFAALGTLQLQSEQTQLAQILRNQRIHVLAQAQSLLESEDPYSAGEATKSSQAGVFAAWQGEAGPALSAFGVKSANELTAYMATQLSMVSTLASEYAKPVLGLFATSGSLADLRSPAPVTFWQGTVQALTDHTNKKPGNPVSALEDFVTTISVTKPEEKAFDLYSCFPLPAAGTSAGFFGTALSELRGALDYRCGELADSQGSVLYETLAQLFNDTLCDKFPFASVDETASAATEDIRAFFAAEFDDAKVLIDNLPSPSHHFSDPKSVQKFMTEMAAVQTFLASYLAPDAKSKVPELGVSVRFRVERTQESGANQIIAWLMSVGQEPKQGYKGPTLAGAEAIDLRTTGSAGPAPTAKIPPLDGVWSYGRPVTLSFRWATGSKYSPYAPATTIPAQRWSVDGRSLLYTFKEPWALLRFLETVDKASSTSGTPDDTLELSIVTISDDRPEPRSVARTFIQITLLTVDGKAVLELPDFPGEKAP